MIQTVYLVSQKLLLIWLEHGPYVVFPVDIDMVINLYYQVIYNDGKEYMQLTKALDDGFWLTYTHTEGVTFKVLDNIERVFL